MNIGQFAIVSDLPSIRDVVPRVRLLAFYKLERESQSTFVVKDVGTWFQTLNLPAPNNSRLRRDLRESPDFVTASGDGRFALHARTIAALRKQYPLLAVHSEDIESLDSILPAVLYQNTRGFVEQLAKQINAAYEHNIFDGCAVLSRRLLEVLLILAYEAHAIDAVIRDPKSGDYLSLDRIITDAKSNSTLSLSRNTRAHLDEFRHVGNFSAHKIYYNARRNDIKRLITEYRAVVEEMLYKAGLRR
jgi:hypothetical protein